MTNVGSAYHEAGLDAALFDDERSGRPIDFDDRERSRVVANVPLIYGAWCAAIHRKATTAGRST